MAAAVRAAVVEDVDTTATAEAVILALAEAVVGVPVETATQTHHHGGTAAGRAAMNGPLIFDLTTIQRCAAHVQVQWEVDTGQFPVAVDSWTCGVDTTLRTFETQFVRV